MPSVEQHSELFSQRCVGAGEQDSTGHAVEGQAEEEHVCAQPGGEGGVEVVEGDDEQSGEVHPHQGHRQPADQQVGLSSLGAALLPHG